MASIHRDVLIDAPAAALWAALSDVGALHTRLVPGFVTHCEMDGDEARQIRFANGVETRELIVSVDAQARRLVWSAAGGRLTHHNASAQVLPEGDSRCRVVWIADLLPHAMAPAIATMIEAGLRAMKAHAEAAPARI
ncbi:SRPBCC family protein [Roseateles sp. NT4]|uniref:SRPBCC family protein n=1 Tax=Roseateles sp. NT4 TaxID=3453715 RepID=UPI003EEFF0E3